MGNCVSQAGQKEFLRNFQNLSNSGSEARPGGGGGGGGRVAGNGGAFMSDNDQETFQVFIKKRNKFIPGN